MFRLKLSSWPLMALDVESTSILFCAREWPLVGRNECAHEACHPSPHRRCGTHLDERLVGSETTLPSP